MMGDDKLGRLKRILNDPQGGLAVYADVCNNLNDMYVQGTNRVLIGWYFYF